MSRRVVLVDDHGLFLAGVKSELGDAVEVVETDIGLATAVLSAANQLPSRTREGVGSVPGAIAVLGARGTLRLAAALPTLRPAAPGDRLSIALSRLSAHAILARAAAGSLTAKLGEGARDELRLAAALHDIGKVGIPDRILLKPGNLDREEFELMKMHAVYGRDTIMLVEKHIGGSNSFLMFAREIAHSHQEKWDGSGYPQNLVGEQIPLSARLMAVADVYDALISKRVYKPAFTHEQALEILDKEVERGWWDGEVVGHLETIVSDNNSFAIV